MSISEEITDAAIKYCDDNNIVVASRRLHIEAAMLAGASIGMRHSDKIWCEGLKKSSEKSNSSEIETASAPETRQFRITFNGKTKGAIGISQDFTETVEATNAEEAILKLYDKYDHIHLPFAHSI